MIAIKNFEMPKDCDSCPFYTYYNNDADDCRITGEEVQNVKLGERHPRCPLVDVEFDYRNDDVGAFQSRHNQQNTEHQR